MKSNFERFIQTIEAFFIQNNIETKIIPIGLHEASKNDAKKNDIQYFYNREELQVIDMDMIAKKPYHDLRALQEFGDTKDDIINTSDGFVINKDNKWFFLEFKDTKINGSKSSLKNNILKKAYCNWYMIMDILFNTSLKDRYPDFDYSNPIKFAKENVVYILICNSESNPKVAEQIHNNKMINKKYTPVFMQRLKEYLFLDAYVYTEIELEREFVKKFQY